MRRRSFMKAGALLAAGLVGGSALGGCGPRPPLRIALHRWPGYVFLRFAAGSGLIQPGVLDLVETSVLSDSVAALRDGIVDAAGVTLDEVLGLRAAGFDCRIVLIFDVSAGADAVLAGPDIASPSDLRGQRIGVEDGSLGAIMLAKLLQRAGLDHGDVEPVPISGDHVAAWTQGNLDAVITYEPAAGRLRRMGLRHLFDSSEVPQLVVDVLAVRGDVAANRALSVGDMVAGHFAAMDLWRTNPIDTAYHLAPLLDAEPDMVERQFVGLDLPDLPANRAYLDSPAVELTRAAREIAAILHLGPGGIGDGGRSRLFTADFLPGDGA